MAAMASPTSPSSPFLPAHLAAANALRGPPRQGTGGQTNAVKPTGGPLRQPAPAAVSLAVALSLPRQGTGGQTNAVLEVKPRGGALRRPAPPGGAGPREGSGGRGGVVHAVTVAVSGPKRPSSPAEGTGGSGGVVHAASS
ncbi:hypothetical protein ABZP36_025012 [Zizania latifolia]